MTSPERPPRVLLVADDLVFQEVVREWLSPCFDLACPAETTDINHLLEQAEPDLVILDVLVPGPDCFDICRRIHGDPRFAGLPVLFLTSRKEDEYFVRNLRVSGMGFLPKPITQSQLRSMLRELLEEKSRNPSV